MLYSYHFNKTELRITIFINFQVYHRSDKNFESSYGFWGRHLKITGSPHKLCDRLYFEFIEETYGNHFNVENTRIIVLDCDKYSHLTSK